MPGSFQPHLKLARHYWQECLQPGTCAVDATCGNGHDTLTLCQLVLKENNTHVYAYDIQHQAILATRQRLEEHLTAAELERVILIEGCHSRFEEISKELPVGLIVYNLGYLPGGDKSRTTLTKTTMESIENACNLIAPGGLISITCYPGHPEGALEEEMLLPFAEKLSSAEWCCTYHRRINRERSPGLLSLQKL